MLVLPLSPVFLSELKIRIAISLHLAGASPRSFDWVDEFKLGGDGSGYSKPPTPKFRFLVGFRSLHFGNIEKSKDSKHSEKKYLEICDFWGTSPKKFEPGGGGSSGGYVHACTPSKAQCGIVSRFGAMRYSMLPGVYCQCHLDTRI